MDTDTVSAASVALAVGARTGVPVLPAIPYGCSLGHSRRWPGTLSLEPATLTRVVVEVLRWVHHAGFRRVLMLNGHVTNWAPLRCALEYVALGARRLSRRAPRRRRRVGAGPSGVLRRRRGLARQLRRDLADARGRARPGAGRRDGARRRSGSDARPLLRAPGEPHQHERRHRLAEPGDARSG